MIENIGVFSTHTLWPTHFETDLELIQSNIDLGNKVFIFHCDKSINQCEMIWDISQKKGVDIESKRDEVCNWCLAKQKSGFGLIEGEFFKVPIISVKERKSQYTVDSGVFKNKEKLKELVVDNHYDLGWSLISSINSCYRDPFVSVLDHKKELTILHQDCSRIYYSAKEYIKKHALSKIYVFNGRLAYTKAILAAAKSMDIVCCVHERASSINKYSLFENHTVHNISEFTKRVYEHWELEEDLDIKNEIGSQFYKDRENGILGSWTSFIDKQDPSLLPENWNHDIYNISVFTSSEDEYSSISSEWDNPFFDTQLKGLQSICDIVSSEENIALYIRIHPNTEHMPSEYRESLDDLRKYKNVVIVNYSSSISSYQLLKNSHTIVTFGSTMGMESIFWGKPSILLGKSLYCQLQGPVIPKDIVEMRELLLNKNLASPKENEALKYGYFLNSFGQKYKYYKPIDYKSGTFKGVDLNVVEGIKPNIIVRVVNKVKRTVGLS